MHGPKLIIVREYLFYSLSEDDSQKETDGNSRSCSF